MGWGISNWCIPESIVFISLPMQDEFVFLYDMTLIFVKKDLTVIVTELSKDIKEALFRSLNTATSFTLLDNWSLKDS